MDENNLHIKALQRKGGITAVYENGFVTICRGEVENERDESRRYSFNFRR
jgi:hypothetical protein